MNETIAAPQAPGWWGDAFRRFARNRAAVVGLIVIAVFGLMALLAPWVDHHPPDHGYTYIEKDGKPVVDANGDRIIDQSAQLARPSRRFWLGTDWSSRDQYSMLVHGARVSLAIGIGTQLIALTIGLCVGMAAGLGGRKADTALMRFTDIAYAFPDLLLIILLVSIFNVTFWMIVLAIALASWMTIARLVRGQVLSLQQEEYVLAARALGASSWRIAWRHLLPNVMGPVIVTATFGIPAAIFAEAALSFIGFGLETASWGRLISDVQANSYTLAAPYLAVSSCLAVAITMMSFSFIGDGLRDALDPRSTGGRQRLLPGVQDAPKRAPEPVATQRAA
jgi:oligopeptide transport system permease protein